MAKGRTKLKESVEDITLGAEAYVSYDDNEANDATDLIEALASTSTVDFDDDTDTNTLLPSLNDNKSDEDIEREEFNKLVISNKRDDYKKSRDTIVKLISYIQEPFKTAVEQSVESGDAKMISALASLLNAAVSASIKLNELSDKAIESIPVDKVLNETKEISTALVNNNQTNVQNNYYTNMTTEDLLLSTVDSDESEYDDDEDY